MRSNAPSSGSSSTVCPSTRAPSASRSAPNTPTGPGGRSDDRYHFRLNSTLRGRASEIWAPVIRLNLMREDGARVFHRVLEARPDRVLALDAGPPGLRAENRHSKHLLAPLGSGVPRTFCPIRVPNPPPESEATLQGSTEPGLFRRTSAAVRQGLL